MGWRNAIVKFILGTLLGLSVAVLAAFNVLLAWVATGPRSLDVLTPYIELAFEPPDHKYSVSIGETWLIWDGWKHPIDIRLRNVKVITSQRHTYVKLPDISLGLDLFSLVKGRILPTSLVITHPVISLYQNEDRSISFGMESEPPPEPSAPAPAAENAQVPFAAIMSSVVSPDASSPLRSLRLVSIVNADVIVSSKRKGVFFKTSGAEFSFKRNNEGLRMFASTRIAYEKYQSLLTAQFNKKNDSTVINGELSVNELVAGPLVDLFIDNSAARGLKFPVSGKLSLQADMHGAMQKLGFNVNGGNGVLESDQLDSPMPVSSIHAEGQADYDTDKGDVALTISQLDANLDDSTLIEGSGTAELRNKDPEVHAKIVAQHLAAQKLHKFWPTKLAPKTREWVTENITDGNIVQAQAKVNIAHGDTVKPFLPQEDIDALVELTGAKIRYLPEHPEVMGVKGKVHIDGKALEATLDAGHYMKDTHLTSGRVLIEDLNPDNPYIKVNIAVESNARDAIHFLELPPVSKAKKLNLKPEAAEGKIKGKAAIGFHFFASRDANGNPTGDDVDYDVAAQLTGMSQPGFMNRFDGKNVDGTLTVNNKELVFKGKGEVNGASVSESTVKYLFKPEQGFDTFIDATATAPKESLPRFGYPAFDFLNGQIGAKVSMKDGKTAQTTKASIDLTHAMVTFPTLYFTKPDREPAFLDITVDKKEGALVLSNLHFRSKGVDAQGSGDLSKDMSGLQHIHLDKLVAGATKLDQLNYESTAGGFNLEMHGDVFDFSPWLGWNNSKEESNFSFEHFPALQLKMDVGRVITGPGRELRNMKGSVNCDIRHCESADVAGVTADNKPFSFRILRNPKGRRQLSLHAQSAGQFLRAANVFDGMEGGDLTITGNYTEATEEKPSILRGRVDINEHTVKNAPVLAKILTVASLTGIFDMLGGKGISFDHLTAPFTLSHDVITLDNAKTHGAALGMTADGTLTFPKGTFDIQGTIVPSYTLNHVLGNVPLIGHVLTGGEGQGVFAARYSLKGSTKDPQVSVNPLSILTPGFLRGLFDIIGSSPKKEEDEDEDAQ